MKTAVYVALIPIAIALFAVLAVLGAAIASGALHAMVLDLPFRAGWDAAWASPGWTLLWALLFTSPASTNAARNRRRR